MYILIVSLCILSRGGAKPKFRDLPSVKNVNLKLILSLTLILTFQYGLGQDKELGFYFKEKAEQFKEANPDSSIFYILQAMKILKDENNFLEFLECEQKLALYYEIIGDYTKTDSIVKVNWDSAKKNLSPSNPEEALTYTYAAGNMAATLLWEGQLLQGIRIYEEAIPIFEKVESQNPVHIAYFFLNASGAYDDLGDFQQALRLNERVLRISQNYEIDPLNIFFAQSNIGFTYLRNSQLGKALNSFVKLDSVFNAYRKQFENPNEHAMYLYRGKSRVFYELGEIDSALVYANKAFSLIEFETASNRKANTYNILGATFIKKNKPQKALEALKSSLEINNPRGEDYAVPTAHKTYLLLAELYNSQNQLKLAENVLEKALKICKKDTTRISYLADDYAFKFWALETIIKKINLIHTNESKFINSPFPDEINLGKDLIYQIRQSFQLEGSKLNLAKLAHSFFESSLLHASKLKPDGSKKSGEMFSFIEEGKSILLYEALLEQEAQLGLTPKLKNKEKNLKRDLAYYEKSLYDERNGENQDSEKIAALEDSVYALQQRYNSFQDTLESDYPSYYQQKYNLELASLKEVENQLKVNEAFLQYFVGDSSIFVMGIHPEKQVFQRIPFSDSLLSTTQAYLEFLSSPNELSSEERGDTYVQNAHMLYKTLLAPVLSQLPEEIDRLIISPDGILSYIPFEALLEELPQESWRYSDLTYLIHSHAVSYTHSATHWLEQQEPSEQKPPHNWLGFAPSYDESQITESVQPLALNRFLTRDGSVQLPHAQEEIAQISEMIGGQGFFQTSALESDFHRKADQYQVLHLATHGLVEDQQPLYSKLVFAPEDDSVYDGFLHAYEIYNMRLPANLVVLSACNTGVGKLEKGEGIMSLSRAFFYAGVKSLLMSLWKVSDESSSELMVSFYEGLKAGKDKDLALQQAKVDYIQNQEFSMKSHPYFWAGFVLKGDAGELSFKSSRGYWVYFLVGFLVLLGLVFWLTSLRKKFRA